VEDMVIVKEDSALVGVSEFRTKAEEIFNELKNRKVIIEKRNKPIAVLLSLKKYEQMEELFEWIEDNALGYLAKEREKSTTKTKYLSLEELSKKIGLR
jgi:prevent-host-death family protein